MKIVLALGGNALLDSGQRGTYEEQVRNVRTVAKQVMKIIDRGHQLVITHGNGPQVGNIAIQESSTAEVPENPLHVLDAMTQGEIGYLIQRELGNLLRGVGSKRGVVSLISQVYVDRADPAFKNPSKPIGPFYSEEEAKKIASKKGFVMKAVSKTGARRFRRVVPSPEPVRMVEADAIGKILGTGPILVAGGGGGIPVVRNAKGEYEGVDAVIDKDLCAERLAEAVRADVLLVLTNIEKVRLNYGTPKERAIDSMTVSEAKEYLRQGQFPAGTMGPKVVACVRFAEWSGKVGIIASLEQAVDALDGAAGTRVVPG
ncbi:MAG TPA: carbamate kinase [Nitrososphaerales archaeon]|nr:carbamate kinase [Nitrososphaerales archaeon]